MHLFIQYVFLNQLLLQTHRAIQTPSMFKLPYDNLHLLLWPKSLKWRTACLLCAEKLVDMTSQNDGSWLVSITDSGLEFLLSFRTERLKAVGAVILAVLSGIFGYVLGS